jgi:hypothetical protein
VIGRRLNVPVVSRPPEEAADHFGWFALFAALDVPASSALTRERLGWQPKRPGLISDLDRPSYQRIPVVQVRAKVLQEDEREPIRLPPTPVGESDIVRLDKPRGCGQCRLGGHRMISLLLGSYGAPKRTPVADLREPTPS